MARTKRIEFEDVEAFVAQSMINKNNLQFFRDSANATVKDVIYRLRDVYVKHNYKVSWNHIVATGMRLFALQRAGISVDKDLARKLNKFNLSDDVIDDILVAIVGGGGANTKKII